MNRTYLAPIHPGRGEWIEVEMARREGRSSTDEPDIPGSHPSGTKSPGDDPFITMHRTYLGFASHLMYLRQLTIFETYEAFVHNDVPDIARACTHDEPDILLPMNRTYLGRALTMNRT